MAANDFLSGFRTGADAYNQARALKDRRDATKQQGEFDKLRLKLEEERNALTKQGLDDTAAFREKSLAEQVASREDASARDNRRIENDTRRVENDSERLRMQGEELSMRMEEMKLRSQLTGEQLRSLRYDNQVRETSLEAYDDLTAALAKAHIDTDALENESTSIKTLVNDALTNNPAVADTPNFKALTQRLRDIESEKLAIKESQALKFDMVRAWNSDPKTAHLAAQAVRDWGQQAKGATMDTVTQKFFDKDGNEVTVGSKVPAGSYDIEAAKGKGSGVPGGGGVGDALKPNNQPRATPGQASAFSVLNLK